MSNLAEIENQLRQFIQENFLIDEATMKEISNTDNLPEKGIIDSFGIMEIINHVEEKFSITFKDTEITLDNLASINAVANFILRKKNG